MDRLTGLAGAAIEARVFPGCVIAISRAGVRHVQAFGCETYGGAPLSPASVYDLASVTKSVVATLALQLIDERRLSLDDPVPMHIPEYRESRATVRNLLTYTLGNRMPLSRLRDRTPAEIFTAICEESCAEPGTVFAYSNTPAFLLGIIIERRLGKPLDAAARERIFAPLGMHSATFVPHSAVPTEAGVSGIVHDESARVFARAGRAVGHAGLFADASDLLLFLEDALRRKDARLSTNQIPGLGCCALGWELDQPWMGETRSAPTFGKTGFTGTSVLCDPDPDRDLAVVILSNRTYPERPRDNSAITAFRKEAHDILRATV